MCVMNSALQKQDKKMCGMAQMYSWLTTLYGNSDDFNWSQFGLPQDKVRPRPNPVSMFCTAFATVASSSIPKLN